MSSPREFPRTRRGPGCSRCLRTEGFSAAGSRTSAAIPSPRRFGVNETKRAGFDTVLEELAFGYVEACNFHCGDLRRRAGASKHPLFDRLSAAAFKTDTGEGGGNARATECVDTNEENLSSACASGRRRDGATSGTIGERKYSREVRA